MRQSVQICGIIDGCMLPAGIAHLGLYCFPWSDCSRFKQIWAIQRWSNLHFKRICARFSNSK